MSGGGRGLQPLEPGPAVGQLGLELLLAVSGGLGSRAGSPELGGAKLHVRGERAGLGPGLLDARLEARDVGAAAAPEPRARTKPHSARPTSPIANPLPPELPPSSAYGVSCRARAEGVALHRLVIRPGGGHFTHHPWFPRSRDGGRIGIQAISAAKAALLYQPSGSRAVSLVPAATKVPGAVGSLCERSRRDSPAGGRAAGRGVPALRAGICGSRRAVRVRGPGRDVAERARPPAPRPWEADSRREQVSALQAGARADPRARSGLSGSSDLHPSGDRCGWRSTGSRISCSPIRRSTAARSPPSRR